MFRVKRKHSRARTSEGRDSRAMPSTLVFVAILVKALVVNGISRIARRLGTIGGLEIAPTAIDEFLATILEVPAHASGMSFTVAI